MPHIDARSGEVVIRIVYDGAPEAGKTTNVQQLSNLISLQRRGASKSPGTTGERTEFFDWLDFSGGYLDGRRVRCQLVSVPGQSRLLHRRRYLLETADAVVFVADSRVEMFDGAAGNFLATLRIVERVCRGVPVGVIVQANKQDLPGALAPEMVMAALGATKPVLAIGSAASRGDGVMQTFILAVRLATDRVRTLLLDETLSDLPMASETPDGLHGAMVEIEGNAPPPIPPLYSPPPPVLDDDVLQSEASGERERLAAETLRIAAERAEAERAEAERAEAERAEAERLEAERAEAERLEAERAAAAAAERLEAERAAAERIASEQAEAAVLRAVARVEAERQAADHAAEQRLAAGRAAVERPAAETHGSHPQARDPAGSLRWMITPRRNRLVAGSAPPIPDATEISSGHVWPPVKGRAAIAFAADGPFTIPEVVRPWAPAGALELLSDSGWVLHTTERWVFESEPEARRHLLTLVRDLIARATSIPDGRSLAVAMHGEAWRLWLVTPRVPSVLEALLAAFAEASVVKVTACVERTLAGLRELGAVAPILGGLAGLTLHDGRLGILGIEERGTDAVVTDPMGELFDLLDRHAHVDPALGRWLDTEGLQLLSRARGGVRL